MPLDYDPSAPDGIATSRKPQSPPPAKGISSILDTDLYKLTMQCAVLKYFPDIEVEYRFTNRTPEMRLTREGFESLEKKVSNLSKLSLTKDELEFLKRECPYFSEEYLNYLKDFRLRPAEHVSLSFEPLENDPKQGDLHVSIKGLWVETIVYEIPLLALISETYFKFVDTAWDNVGQLWMAGTKCQTLLENGCIVSEFGTRRRRSYETQDLVLKGCCDTVKQGDGKGWKGKLTGTSNVHFAMKHKLSPVGTVAHEWYMGIAAITDNYEDANELALRYWVGTFGEGILGIALTDTFGTAACYKAFRQVIPTTITAADGAAATPALKASSTTTAAVQGLGDVEPPSKPELDPLNRKDEQRTYAEVFAGVRQDSGDPASFVKMTREFYDSVGIKDRKSIVFSDSLNIDLCLEYKKLAEEAGFQPSFGVGTFFTNDFINSTTRKKSVPMNIVIKISRAAGRPAVKISDNIGKNTGDEEVVRQVKARLGYTEQDWKDGDESQRWGKEGDTSER